LGTFLPPSKSPSVFFAPPKIKTFFFGFPDYKPEVAFPAARRASLLLDLVSLS